MGIIDTAGCVQFSLGVGTGDSVASIGVAGTGIATGVAAMAEAVGIGAAFVTGFAADLDLTLATGRRVSLACVSAVAAGFDIFCGVCLGVAFAVNLGAAFTSRFTFTFGVRCAVGFASGFDFACTTGFGVVFATGFAVVVAVISAGFDATFESGGC